MTSKADTLLGEIEALTAELRATQSDWPASLIALELRAADSLEALTAANATITAERDAALAQIAGMREGAEERLARAFAESRCGEHLSDERWDYYVSHYREMCAKWPAHEKASAFVNDAFRDARIALAALPLEAPSSRMEDADG